MIRKMEHSKHDTRRVSGNLYSRRYVSRAIENVMGILGGFKRSPEPLSLSQLTAMTNLAKSSVFRVLHTLEAMGYLEKAGGDRYTLSPLIASMIPDGSPHELLQVASPFVKDLNREFRETVSVAYLFANRIEVIMVAPSPEKVQMGNIVGSIIPPHASSLGKCITAGQSESRREQLLLAYGNHPITPRTITDGVELAKEFDRVRENGYAVDAEESAQGGYCFGAPIYGEGKHVIGAISVSMPKTRYEDPTKVIAALRTAAAKISEKIKLTSTP